MIENLVTGLQTALHVYNLMYAFVGVLIGNLIGVLPGVGALAAISMLLPVTYGLSPTAAIIMIAGIYYGTSFGGATTSILLNLPGTPTHAVICVDGNPMAKEGRGGQAILAAMVSSFFGVCFGALLMMGFAPTLAKIALNFGPAEYFTLMLLGVLAAAIIGTTSPTKGVISVMLGLLIGTVGIDVTSGVPRFTFGSTNLQDGVSLVALALALFGIVDILEKAGLKNRDEAIFDLRNKNQKTSEFKKHEKKKASFAALRGSAIGSFFGILPGTGGTLAAFMSYAVEKKVAREPDRFGHGAIEGVAGPESANSSASITAFIPTLTLGIPGDAVMALILGALLIHDVKPGPLIIEKYPELFWGLTVSFLIGNLMLLILNIPFIKIWVKLLRLPYRYMFPMILVLICIASFSESNNYFDVYMVIVVGFGAFLLRKVGIEGAPLLLGFVLGPMMEENFRRALLLSRGDLLTFIVRPISGILMLLIGVGLIIVMVRQLKLLRRSGYTRSAR